MFWSYEHVCASLDGSDCYVFRNLVGTAFVRGQDGDFHLEYHNSKLVTYHPDNTYTLDSCGFMTRTTKMRLNEFSPIKIVQRGGLWQFDTSNGRQDFFDGIRVDSYGEIVEDEEDEDRYAVEATVDNQIAKTYL